METLNYYQTLEIVENFVIKTGIRDFCTNVCKGSCCGRCYTSENACHKHEGRRLACSAFVCSLPVLENDRLNEHVAEGRYALNKVISAVYRKHNDLGMKPPIVYTGEVYFFVPSPLLFTEFKVDATTVNKCFVDLISPVKKIVDEVKQAWDDAKSIIDEYSTRWTSSKFSNFVIRDDKVVHYYMWYHRYCRDEATIARNKHTYFETKKDKTTKKKRTKGSNNHGNVKLLSNSGDS